MSNATINEGVRPILPGDKRPVTRGVLDRTMRSIGEMLGEMLGTRFAAHERRDAALEQRMVALEARLLALEQRSAGVKWAGTWKQQRAYREGELVTHKGSLWLATCETVARPGQSADWILTVKTGDYARLEDR